MEESPPPQRALSISVALCTRNGAAYVREQIRSICAQSLVPDEIVLSDDASDDASIKIAMEEVAHRAVPGRPALRLLRNPAPLGVTANFEQAVRACKGDLIALCDQDDVWQSDRMARIANEFSRRPSLQLLHSDARIVDQHGDPLGYSLFQVLAVRPSELRLLHGGRAFEVLLRRNVVTGATTVLRRSLLSIALPFPMTWLHDEWLAAIAAYTAEVDVLEEPLIDYRQHERNLVGARRLRWRDAVQRALASRAGANTLRVRKVAALLERVSALAAVEHPIDPGKLELLRAQLRHQQARANLPVQRVARIVPVMAEMVTGNYWRFGPGLRVAVADLLQQA
jgi:glycosyltransferase involved in cell wall biosynthesis